jgi:cell division protein ZapB
MISDFKQLSQKISQLAALSLSLRRENDELRAHIAMLNVENTDINHRMHTAYERISNMLSQLPPPQSELDTAHESTT